jgi:hypothetical protein
MRANASSSASVVFGALITMSSVPLRTARPFPALTAYAASPRPCTVTTGTPLLATFCDAAKAAAVTGEPNVILVGTTNAVVQVHVLLEPVELDVKAEARHRTREPCCQ